MIRGLKKYGVGVVTGLVVLWAAQANATLIQFEGIDASGNPILSSYSEAGFNVAGPHFHIIGNPATCGSGCVSNGTQYITEEEVGVGFPFSLARAGGGTFSLNDFDGAELALSGFVPNAATIRVTGTLSGGGNVVATFTLDGIFDGAGGLADFQPFILPGTFTGLTSVLWEGFQASGARGAFSVDDVLIDSGGSVPPPPPGVPGPATLGLVALGLLALAGVRRRFH